MPPGTRIRVELIYFVMFFWHASPLTSQLLIIILHVIKLFRIHLKALVKIVYYILKERKKDVHLLKFTKPPIM